MSMQSGSTFYKEVPLEENLFKLNAALEKVIKTKTKLFSVHLKLFCSYQMFIYASYFLQF